MTRFEERMPAPRTELNFLTPYQLMVAVILSAQCTDRRVNMITPSLFERFPDEQALAEADTDEIYEYIKSVSYPNNKAKSLKGAAAALHNKYHGEMPDDMDELLTIPGVGRKTANVLLSVIFNKPAMAVDTHVFRVSDRLGLTTGCKTPLATEKKLVKYIRPDLLPRAHHWLILHGRYICLARKPKCDECFLTDLCRYYNKNNKS